MPRPRRAVVIADEVEALIRGGRYAPGEQVPPVAQIMTRWQTSNATASEVLRLLQDRGLVESDRRGTYVVDVLPGAADREQRPLAERVAQLERDVRVIKTRLGLEDRSQ